MPEIWTMGEMLVEIMRPRAGMQLSEAGEPMEGDISTQNVRVLMERGLL